MLVCSCGRVCFLAILCCHIASELDIHAQNVLDCAHTALTSAFNWSLSFSSTLTSHYHTAATYFIFLPYSAFVVIFFVFWRIFRTTAHHNLRLSAFNEYKCGSQAARKKQKKTLIPAKTIAEPAQVMQ